MRLGLIGFGSIGQTLLQRLPRDLASDVTVLVRRQPDSDPGWRLVLTLDDLIAAEPDLVVECAGHSAAQAYLIPLLRAGVSVMPASLGVFSDDAFFQSAKDAAQQTGAEIILPSGAIGGLDILRALSAAGGVQVTYRGIKPPKSWKGSHAEDIVDLGGLTSRAVFYTGTAREAAAAYPKNANVVAALALAGPGFDAVSVELVADPAAAGNTHSYSVTSPICRYEMTIENAASAANARTSETTILSLLSEVQVFAQRQGLAAGR